MHPTLRVVLAVIAGLVVGGLCNSAIVLLGPLIVSPPAGADLTTAEGLKASMHLLEPRHFAMPFLAHAIGTLLGALTAAALAPARRAAAAYAIGVLFLIGGISASLLIPAPSWFIALDLLGAYLPMAWLGLRIAEAANASRPSFPDR